MVGGNINDSGAGQAQQAFKEDPAPKYQDLTDEEVKKLVKAKVDQAVKDHMEDCEKRPGAVPGSLK